MRKPKQGSATAPLGEPELLTVAQAAEMLHRSKMTVRALIRSKRLEARLVLFEVRVLRTSVERLLRPRPYRPTRKPPKRARPVYGQPAPPLQPANVGGAS